MLPCCSTKNFSGGAYTQTPLVLHAYACIHTHHTPPLLKLSAYGPGMCRVYPVHVLEATPPTELQQI